MSTLFQFFLWCNLVAAGQGIVIGLVLLRSRFPQPGNKLLGWLMIAFAASMGTFVLNNTIAATSAWYPGTIVTWAVASLFGPLLLKYVRLNTGFSGKLPFNNLHYIPLVIFSTEILFFYMIGRKALLIPSYLLPFISNSILLVYVGIAWWQMKAYNKKVIQFNEKQTKNLISTNRLLLYFACFGLSLCTYVLSAIVKSMQGIYIALGIKLLFAAAIYYISYFRMRAGYQSAPFTSQPVAEKYKTTTLSIETADYILKRLTSVMENEKLYGLPNLKLKDVSDKLGTSTNHLSRVINERLGMSFPDYINKLRIETAKQLLLSDEDPTMESIAYRTGFNNKTSFNKAFKKFTECTPSQYKAGRHVKPGIIEK